MSSPAATRGEAVRQRLLAAALELVPERGWPAVSTRVLAERAGVTPSVVHYHFSSVQALLVEAVLGAMRAMTDEVTLDQANTPEEAVDAIVGSVEQYTGADPMSLLFIEAYLAATRDDELRRGIAEVLDGLRARLAAWFGDHGVPDADGTAAVLAAAVDGLLLHRALSPAPAPAAAVLRRLVVPA
ncbi:TetR/AcrR family transcriptional regulator [Amycolatopsis sp. OK19-0408]|uniref:TetR/AcrR family transcriptional regulator n=1 Tax=Amycolatopsis iheyensis TaxID=2945988 RepID=A0A9X2NE74_9PSEU|nr:TetR/AcrR family transcriptional regulator [Amycolatopsis iheyensis]MCR6485616.1 TetR/AcrR family transcriptional regulator [Amycolatopsis iheyensis]